MKTWLVDTGPLVAFIMKDDAHHAWAQQVLATVPWPLHTCEPVLSESFFLLQRAPIVAAEALLDLVSDGSVVPSFRLADQRRPVDALMRKYGDVPMALADACLVRMAEVAEAPTVITVDSDFAIYRMAGRAVIPLVAPPGAVSAKRRGRRARGRG